MKNLLIPTLFRSGRDFLEEELIYCLSMMNFQTNLRMIFLTSNGIRSMIFLNICYMSTQDFTLTTISKKISIEF